MLPKENFVIKHALRLLLLASDTASTDCSEHTFSAAEGLLWVCCEVLSVFYRCISLQDRRNSNVEVAI